MKPGNFILDLLRTYGQKGTSAKNIMRTAAMFEFSENLIRVTLSRLASRGLIENFKRGSYRLSEESDPVTEFVEEWRLGEARRRRWHPARYLMVQLADAGSRDEWVLAATGFVSLQQGFWVRPDNLRRQGDELTQWLVNLGLNNNAVIGQQLQLSDPNCDQTHEMYDRQAMDANYQALSDQLEKSTKQLAAKPVDVAMKESFTLGGRALQLLAKDPYLPAELQSPSIRERLWQTMLAYDELGRSIWSGAPTSMPASITSYA